MYIHMYAEALHSSRERVALAHQGPSTGGKENQTANRAATTGSLGVISLHLPSAGRTHFVCGTVLPVCHATLTVVQTMHLHANLTPQPPVSCRLPSVHGNHRRRQLKTHYQAHLVALLVSTPQQMRT